MRHNRVPEGIRMSGDSEWQDGWDAVQMTKKVCLSWMMMNLVKRSEEEGGNERIKEKQRIFQRKSLQ